MIVLPGNNQMIAHESVSDKMLIQAGISNPDFIPTIMRLFKEEVSPFISLLDMKGAKTNGLNHTTNDGNYRAVGSNHVQFKTDSPVITKFRLAADKTGKSFYSDYSSTPGKNQTEIVIIVDSNWAGYKEVIELADNKTQLWVIDDPKDIGGGLFRLRTKLYTGDRTAYVDATLLTPGMEAAAVMNLHEQDFSERGTEKYTGGGWADAYLSLQRFKNSWSGTAMAKLKGGKISGKFVMHNGEKSFISQMEMNMMKMAAGYLEYQMMWGQSTVAQDTNRVILHDDNGREVLSGNGIMNANGGPIEIPQNNGWTKQFLDDFLVNIDQYITTDNMGRRELVLLMAPRAYLSFQTLMGSLAVTANANIIGTGAKKGIIDTYEFYELNGIRLIPKRHKNFSNLNRPGMKLKDGTYTNEWETIAAPIGETENGMKNFELIQLRPSVKGKVAGLDQGGNISSSVDGSSEHILFQNGIICRGRVFHLFRPYTANELMTY